MIELFWKKKKLEQHIDKNISLIGAYKYNDDVTLVEITIDESPTELLLDEFFLYEKNVSQRDSQAPYLEQFLDSEGKKRISDIYGNIECASENKSRLTFFLFYANGESKIKTPYGVLEIEKIVSLPDRLKNIIEFEVVE